MKRACVGLSLLLALAALGGEARAAREVGFGIAYDPRVPVGNLRDLVSEVGLVGVQGRFDYYALDSLTAGLQLQYHLFDRGTETETVGITNGAATAPFTRHAYFITVMPTARWFLSPSGTVRPYAEVAAGVTGATGAIYASDLARRSLTSGFVVQPSAGVLLRLAGADPQSIARAAAGDRPAAVARRRIKESMTGITASFAWSFTTADVLAAEDVMYFGIQLGVYAKP